MDPISVLGLTASIIAVLQLTGALLKPATSSLGPSDNDEKELKRLVTNMSGFKLAYDNLEKYIKDSPGTADTLKKAIQEPIRECKLVLAQLQVRLSKMTFVRKHIIGKKWDKEFERLMKRLDDARQLFDVILQGDQTERLNKISLFLAQKFEGVDEIKETVEMSAERLSELHSTVQKNHQNAELQSAQNQSHLLQILDTNQDKIDEQFLRHEKIQQRTQKQEILRWLEITDPSTNHNQACKSHKPGTGNWFVKGQIYRDWLAEPESFVWLNGKAGCGKTVLSSAIIENFNAYCDENEGCVMAYFYFSFTDSNKQHYPNMLRSLLAQIASQVDITPDCLISLHRAYERSTPPSDALTKALRALVEEIPCSHVYILVDALDEIPDTDGREETCEILYKLSQMAKVHMIMTSRREHDITGYVSECKTVKDISIQNSEVDHDIRLWIRDRLKEDKKLKKWSGMHDEIESVLSKQADGMFRWAACQLDSLKKCLTAKSVQKALESLPKTLDETYERMLLAIDDEWQNVAKEALRWLCFSEKVLTVSELAEAAVFSAVVQVPSEETPFEVSFDPSERIEDPLDVLDILSGLIVVRASGREIVSDESDWEDSDSIFEDRVEDDGGYEVVGGGSKILLAHFSVKEYLVSRRLRSEVLQFAIDESRVHQLLATNCLYYAFYSQQFLEYNTPSRAEIHSIASYPLLNYALAKWIQHTKRVEFESELNELVIALFSAEFQLQRFLIYDHLFRDDGDLSHALSPLYILSYLGLYLPCKRLLETGSDVNTQAGWFGSALQAASYEGRENIVELLLRRGANVNARGGIFGTALQAASFNGRESIVKLLLEHGADINVQGGLYGTVLQAASLRGFESIVKLLLEHGVNVTAQGGKYGTVLQAASSDGYKSIVKLLLKHGADVNAQGGRYGTALQAASFNGYESIVKLLLKHGADVNAQGGRYGTALQAASFNGYENIVKLLLEHGANIDAQGGFYGTALQAASGRGKKEVVQILLDHGADVNTQGKSYNSGSNPLQAALMENHVEISIMLLERGAIPTTIFGGTEAQEALRRKDFKTFVKMQMDVQSDDSESYESSDERDKTDDEKIKSVDDSW